MKGRHTSLFADIFGISPIPIVILLIDIPIKSMALVYLALAVLIFELIAKFLFRMSVVMTMRKIARSLISIVYKRGLHGSPAVWRRKHWPNFIVLSGLIFLNFPNEVNAQYTVTNSVLWDRQWRGGALGLGENDVSKAMCRKCPLELGLNQLLPDVFEIYVNEKVGKDIKINFIAGERWGVTLNRIAESHNLDIELHKNGYRVIVDPALDKRGSVSMVSLSPKKESFYEVKSWELIPGETLKAALGRWAKRENWVVIYDLPDQHNLFIDVHAVFKGNLIDAVDKVLMAYKSNGLLPRVVRESSHANRTIKLTMAGKGK